MKNKLNIWVLSLLVISMIKPSLVYADGDVKSNKCDKIKFNLTENGHLYLSGEDNCTLNGTITKVTANPIDNNPIGVEKTQDEELVNGYVRKYDIKIKKGGINISHLAADVTNEFLKKNNVNEITSSTLEISKNKNVGKGNVIIDLKENSIGETHIKDGAITENKLSDALKETINSKLNKDDVYIKSDIDSKLDKKVNREDLGEINLDSKLNSDFSNMSNVTILIEKLSSGADISSPKNKLVTDKQVKNYVDKYLGKDNKKIGGGIASAVAVANIPQVAGDKKFSLGAGISYYDKNGAVAVGVSGQDKDHKVIYKLSTGASFNGAFNIGAGINYNFGKIEDKEDYKKIDDVFDNIKKMGDKIENLNNESKKLKEMIAKTSKKVIKYIISDFDLDKSNIKENQKQKLESVVEIINSNYPDGTVEITGFTDRAYNEQYNLDLGLRRAKNTKEILESLGLSKNVKILIRSDAFNEITDGTPADLRRVEIKISDTIIR